VTDPSESPLLGGNLTDVVRLGDAVRRPCSPWTPTVHALLRHLERRAFTAAPRVLGLDDQKREVLAYMPGEVGHYPLPEWMWSNEVLDAAARLLRRFHDATTSFIPPFEAVWSLPPAPSDGSSFVICHNDFAPYNVVFTDRLPAAIIDFDTVGPGPRVWDIAYALYRWVPLSDDPAVIPRGFSPPSSRSARLRQFCDAYGLDERRDVVDVIEQRLQALVLYIENQAAAGDLAFVQLLASGHADLYRRDLAFLLDHHEEWRYALDT
jgi:hypothetical protein